MKAMIDNGQIANFVPDNYNPGNPDIELREVTGFDFTREKDDDVSKNKTRHESGASQFTIDENGLVSKVSEEEIKATPEYKAKIRRERKAAYELEVDDDNFELMEMISDAIISGFIVINGQSTIDKAQAIKDKKAAIRERIR